MKLWILVEIGWEYNDEFYTSTENESGQPTKAYRVKDNAVAACKAANETRARENASSRHPMTDGDRQPVTEFYRVAEVDVADENVDDYATVRKRADEAMATAKSLARDAFLKSAAPLFAEFPEMESFGWKQYTPYFNDGDPCVFRVSCSEPYIDGEDSEEFERGYTYDQDKAGHYTRKETGVIDPRLAYAEKVTEFIRPWNKDDMLAMFGDHVRVTVNRDGTVETEHYDHD